MNGRVCGCDQIVAPSWDHVQRIAEHGKWPVERIRGNVAKLTILDSVLRESSLVELPIEVVATVLNHMAQTDIIV